MDAALAGLIGTGLGAGIGGTVTVLSLWIKGKQDAAGRTRDVLRDDQIREEDRAWEVRQANLEQRRELYSRLLRMSYLVESRAARLSPKIPALTEGNDAKQLAAPFLEVVSKYEVLASEVQVMAVNNDVIRYTLAIRGRSKDLLMTTLMAEFIDQDALHRNTQELSDAIKTAYRRLIPACRRDLGLADGPDNDDEPRG